ncbi:formin-binding protein 4-like [Diadema antillarum]|uniref:formin-binding protein 4-like n=1 Tax=Diadema antillarum TaxID=105358 RepID=UPI003A857F22
MGKKKDRAVPGMGKRRTVLQIDGGSSMSSKKGYGQNSGGNALRGLMANYGDSDDEQEAAPPQYVDFRQVEAGEPERKPKTEMDAKLADFMAEIDAMDTASNSPNQDVREGKPLEEEAIDGKPVDSKETVSVSEGPEVGAGDSAHVESSLIPNTELTAVGEWQELLDENTNCVYYWNMYTNEVTWEMPDAFRLQLQQQQQSAGAISTPMTEDKTTAEIDGTEIALQPSTDGDVAADSMNGDIDGIEIPNGKLEDNAVQEWALEPEAVKEEMEKLPVYGAAKVRYTLDPVPDELADIVKDDLRDESEDNQVEEEKTKKVDAAPGSKDSKLSYLSAFSKSETLPGSISQAELKTETQSDDEKGNGEGEDEDEESDDGRYDLCLEPVQPAKEVKKEIKKEMKKESSEPYSVDMFADDMDDIDKQLEMALEKKKAELKKLEDAESKKSPEGEDKEKGKKRKSDTADMSSIYDESGGVDLSRFKRKRLENLAGRQKSSGRHEIGTQCNLDDEISPEDKEKIKQKQKAKEEAEQKDQIVELVSTMMNKLEFLGISNKGLNKFQVMLIEMETRIQDWREGLLDSKHLLQRLELSDWELQRYETEAAPSGWLCSWDRTHKQYYYTNMSTNESQWEYPVEAAAADAQTTSTTSNTKETRSAFSSAADRGMSGDREASSGEESMDERDSLDTAEAVPKPSEIQLPELPPDQPPPPPMPSDDRQSPLPPPPLPDGPPPPPPPGEEPPLPPLPPSPPPSTPPAPPPDDTDPSRPLTPPPFLAPLPGMDLPTQPPLPPPTVAKENAGTVIGKPQVLYSAPAATRSGPVIASAAILSAPPTRATLTSDATLQASKVMPAAPPSKSKVKKKRKKEKESKSVKSKLPHSLVSKWAQIKEEQEKEMEESESEEEEDVEIRNQKMIAEWKKEQLLKGKTKFNANFEEIQGDWRERLKRKSNVQ